MRRMRQLSIRVAAVEIAAATAISSEPALRFSNGRANATNQMMGMTTKQKRAGQSVQMMRANRGFIGSLTSELTGTQWHYAARRMLPRTACGAIPLRVRVERPVRPHVPSHVSPPRMTEKFDTMRSCTQSAADTRRVGVLQRGQARQQLRESSSRRARAENQRRSRRRPLQQMQHQSARSTRFAYS